MTAQQSNEVAWRVEFEQAAADARVVSSNFWQVVYVFVSVSVLAIALVTQQLLARDEHSWATFGLVLPIATAGAAFGWLFRQMLRRQTWVQRVTYARLQEIERPLGMRKHSNIDLLDNWEDRDNRADWLEMSKEQQTRLCKVERRWRKRRPSKTGAVLVVDLTFVITLAWVAVAAAELGVVLAS